VHKTVKRNNFIELFLDEYMVDKFVAVHLYGAGPGAGKSYGGKGYNVGDLSFSDLSNLEESLLNLSTTMARKTKRVQKIQ
jgi:hypothetical protein